MFVSQPVETPLKDDATSNPQELIAAIRSGDAEAFSNFYCGYVDSLVGFLTKIIRNEEDAKEITQDTFALLWENREKLDPHTSLKGFVGGIARNLALRMLRDRCKGIDVENMHLFQSEFADMADDNIISEEAAIILSSALRNMPAQRWRVFEMSREEGLTYNEIAAKLNISYNTVVKHIALAKEEIRPILSVILLFFIFRA